MRSPQLQRVHHIAEQIEAEWWRKYKKLGKSPCRDKFRRSVLVCLDEGSIFYLSSSFVDMYENDDGEWYIIFSEHHDTKVYHKDDVAWIKQFKPGEINISKTKWKPTLKLIKG
jgi:hypothetical protein